VDHLLRGLAPISDRGWEAIEAEAGRALRNFLTARRLVDFRGPTGWEESAVGRGRVETLGTAPEPGVEAAVRTVQPMLELRTPFSVARSELDRLDRGAQGPDLTSVVDAARRAASAEDRTVFHGFAAGAIRGIVDSSPHAAIGIDADYEEFPRSVARAVAVLREGGVDGPYGIALGPRCYTGVIETTQKGGYPVLEQLRLITGGPLAWAPAVDGSVVVSTRGGDFEIVCGEDLSIGYSSSDGQRVQLYLEESLTFQVHAPEAAVHLASAT
jgi:uncharacterized linocin/CFP29 family protein